MRSRGIVLALVGITLLAEACSSSSSSSEPDSKKPVTGPAPAVAAENFCVELAKITCASDVKCCSAGAVDEDLSWPTADGGKNTGASADGPTCVTQQTASCRATVGELVTDPRTGYDANAAGTFIAQMKAKAASCFEEPIEYAALISAFRGTGEPGAACTPEGPSAAALRVSSLSCKQGTRCRIYLGADGSPDGVCKAAEEDGVESCSHAFDCQAGQWCEVSGEWKPGVWGQCRPLRTEGWTCSSDLECASQYCDASAKCAKSSPERYCLTLPYESAVKGDAPIAYLRLGEPSGASATDASGHGHSGKRLGNPASASPGALDGDDDDATAFDGLDDGISLSPGKLDDGAVSLELWLRIGPDTKNAPLLAFGSGSTQGIGLAIDDAGSIVADVVDTAGKSHVLSSKDTKPKPDEWHHVVLSYDGYHALLILDGATVATLDGVFTPRVDSELHIGYAGASHFAGAIDEVAVYASALDLARVREHRQIGKTGPGRELPIYGWFD